MRNADDRHEKKHRKVATDVVWVNLAIEHDDQTHVTHTDASLDV